MPPTRRRLGHRSTDRTGVGIPDRFGIRARRSSGPQRSVSDPGKQNASATCIFRLCCRKTREKREGERRSPSGRCIRPKAYRPPGRQNRKCGRGETGASASPARPCGARERGKLVRPVSGQYGSAFPGRNAGRTRNICQTRLHTLLHQPFWEVFSAHTSRWLETLWHGAGWKMHALGTFGILMHIIGRPNTSPYRNPDKKQGSFL